MTIKFIITGLAFIFIFVSGFWMSHKGKPYNVFPNTIHKLISLAVLVYVIMILYQANLISPLGTLELIVSGITVFFFLVLFATGGILSAAKTIPRPGQIVHRILPYVALLSSGATLYLLLIPN
jgi:hypothetical protein